MLKRIKCWLTGHKWKKLDAFPFSVDLIIVYQCTKCKCFKKKTIWYGYKMKSDEVE